MASLWAMPMLIVNMGGEMIYILCQRLEAQKIPLDKSRKVINDVVQTMFNEKFVAELFKPHELYTNEATRDIFDRLAHSSIMRLNKNSMDKLYDLMTMGFKYQMLQCASSDQLVLVTLNHLESIRDFVEGDALTAVEAVIFRVNQVYSEFTMDQFNWLRRTIARFFQDRKVKIKMFLTMGYQEMDGTIKLPLSGHLPEGTPMPGKVEKYQPDGTIVKYDVDLDVLKVHNLKPYAPAVVTMGSNMYASAGGRSLIKPGAKSNACSASGSEGKSDVSVAPAAAETKENASKELNMLASLISPAPARDSGSSFRLNLFPENDLFGIGEDEESMIGAPKGARNVDIDAKRDRKSMATRIAEMGFDDDGDRPNAGASKEPDDFDDDLLDLMDEATEGKY